jgi:hypothetical protein
MVAQNILLFYWFGYSKFSHPDDSTKMQESWSTLNFEDCGLLGCNAIIDQKKYIISKDHIAFIFRVIARNRQTQVTAMNLFWFHVLLTLWTWGCRWYIPLKWGAFPNYTVLQPRKLYSAQPPLWELRLQLTFQLHLKETYIRVSSEKVKVANLTTEQLKWRLWALQSLW